MSTDLIEAIEIEEAAKAMAARLSQEFRDKLHAALSKEATND